jgi:CDP-diacylglycerol--glycerol-3-phosphate 3-phosphatidyltransferase
MNYRDFLQKVIYVMINPLIKAMIKIGITPNIVTLVGFIGNIFATCFFIDAAWIQGMGGVNSDPTLMTAGTSDYTYADCMTLIGWGGFIILASGLFDMIPQFGITSSI